MNKTRIDTIFGRLGRALERRGRVMAQVVTVDDSIDAGDGRVWAMVQFRDGQALTRVRPSRAKPFPGASYKVKPSPDDGVLELLDADPVTIGGFFAGMPDAVSALNTPNHGWTHRKARGGTGLDTVWIDPQQLLGLQARPTSPASLSVTVTDYPPLAFAGGSLDLTSYVPGSGQQRLVIVGLDTTTGTLVAVAADAVSGGPVFAGQGAGASPFTLADVAAVAVDGHVLRIAAVRLYYSQTAIQWSDLPYDLRDVAGERRGYLRLDDDDPTLAGLVDKLTVSTGLTLSRVAGDQLVLSAQAGGSGGWDPDAAPDAPSSYDDEFDDASLAGKWTEFDPGSYVAVAEAGDALTLTFDEQATASLGGVYQAALPSGDYTAVLKATIDDVTLTSSAQGVFVGFGLFDDATDTNAALTIFGYRFSNAAWSVWAQRYSQWDTSSYIAQTAVTEELTFYLRLRWDDSVGRLYFDWSTDAETWTTKQFPPGSLFLSGFTHIGIVGFAQTLDTVSTWAVDVDFFRVRETFDAVGEPVYGQATGGNIVLPTGLASALPSSPAQGSPYVETDTRLLKVGDAGSYVAVAGAPGLMPTPIVDAIVPGGYQATWIIAGGVPVDITGELAVSGQTIFMRMD